MITINLTKWWHAVIAATPVLAMVLTGSMWIDTRYMHRDMQARQNVEIQLDIVEWRIKQYKRMEDAGIQLSIDEEMDLEARIHQREFLTEERNRLNGMGSK